MQHIACSERKWQLKRKLVKVFSQYVQLLFISNQALLLRIGLLYSKALHSVIVIVYSIKIRVGMSILRNF